MNAPDRYAVVGFPVKHSWSPFIHGMFAKQTGQNLAYGVLEVAPNDFAGEVTRFFADSGKGLNITVPHKQSAFSLCTQRTPRAELARAVNTLALLPAGELLGDNTDGAGLVTDLTKNLRVELRAKRILLLGAGGAARGVLGPLLELGPEFIHIRNRDAAKAKVLAEEFKALGKLSGDGFDADDSQPYDLILNATSASLQGVMPPIGSAAITRTTMCYDMAYSQDDTAFTRWAKQYDALAAELGWGMLVEQAAESFYLWRGVRPDTAPVLKAVRSTML